MAWYSFEEMLGLLISNGNFDFAVSCSMMHICKGIISHVFHQVHMEADRKAMPGDTDMSTASHVQEKNTYIFGSKVIFTEFFFINTN